MACIDFSKFDRVATSMIVLSPELKFLYSNAFAKRQYSFLASSKGFSACYPQEVLSSVSERILEGELVTLPLADPRYGSALFEPVFNRKGELSYVCVYASFENGVLEEMLPVLSDGELLRLLQKRVADPLGYTIQTLRLAEQLEGVCNNEPLRQALVGMRFRLLGIALFFFMTDTSVKAKRDPRVHCDANGVLVDCHESFPLMQYVPGERCSVPMDRDAMILVVTDIVSNLYQRQSEKPKISVSLVREEDGSVLTFTSGKLVIPMDQPCDGDFGGVDIGMFSVRHRVESSGGQMEIKASARGTVRITLKFPEVVLCGSRAFLRDDSNDGISFISSCALEYLKLLADPNRPE